MHSVRTALAALILGLSLMGCVAGNEFSSVAPYHSYSQASYPQTHGGLGQAQQTNN